MDIKSLTSFVLILVLAAAPFLPRTVSGAPETAEGPELGEVGCALLLDPVSGQVITAKNADEPMEFAGLVRLPVLLEICLAFDEERIFGNTVVTVSPEAAKEKGATAFLAPNERISAELVLKAAVMLNAGDAVRTLMETLYPSSAAAEQAVTARLLKLGVEKRASGYLNEGAAFSAAELAAVCRELLKSPSFRRFSSVYTDILPHASASDTELVNPNRLVRHYSGCCGIATGSVGSSHYCGAFAARRGSTELLAIVAGAGTSEARFSAARELLDYGFSAYRSVEIMEAGSEVAVLPLYEGLEKELSIVTARTITALLPVNDAKYTVRCVLPHAVPAPVEQGQALGLIRIVGASGRLIAEEELVAAKGAARAGFGDFFLMLAKRFLGVGHEAQRT